MSLRSMARKISSQNYTRTRSQGDGWKIQTDSGSIEYRPVDDYGTRINEIWWVQSSKRGHGSELVDLMMKMDPAEAIAWGLTSESGAGLMNKWHRAHPEIECIKGAHDNQFDPFGHHPDDDSEQ
jgi:hypothetical protein